MSTNTQEQTQSNQHLRYTTPVKNRQKNIQDHDTMAETFKMSNQLSLQLSNQNYHNQKSNKTMNIFQKRHHRKRILKSNLHLLDIEINTLQNMKSKIHQNDSDAVKQLFQQELDKVYVVLARILRIQQQKKYYILYCQDDALKEFKLYFMKNLSPETLQKSPNKKSQHREKRIKNIDQLQFQTKLEKGHPYFKFFTIFREIPIFEKSQQKIVLNSQKQELKAKQNQNKINLFSNPIGTQLRAYIQHFEMIEDFNYIAWHNMHICFEYLCSEKMKTQNTDIQI